MRLLFDQNLAPRLPRVLNDLYPGPAHIRDLGMGSADDTVVWAYARDQSFLIVSKDDDFRHRSGLLGHPPKVVWLRLGNCPTKQVELLLRWRVAQVAELNADPDKSILILH